MNFMERVFVWVFVFVLFFGVVLAEDGWEDINVDDSKVEEDSPKNVSGSEDDSVENKSGSSDSSEVGGSKDVADVEADYVAPDYESGEFYTTSFYVALSLMFVVLVVVGVFVWLWIRGPRNSWEKKESFFDKIKIKIKK